MIGSRLIAAPAIFLSYSGLHGYCFSSLRAISFQLFILADGLKLIACKFERFAPNS
jgi:hypothetical protein